MPCWPIGDQRTQAHTSEIEMRQCAIYHQRLGQLKDAHGTDVVPCKVTSGVKGENVKRKETRPTAECCARRKGTGVQVPHGSGALGSQPVIWGQWGHLNGVLVGAISGATIPWVVPRGSRRRTRAPTQARRQPTSPQ